jgi:hypothetical protein
MDKCGDCYIVRVYRRDENNPENMVGLVEIVGIQTKRFVSREHLLSIISTSGSRKSATGLKKRKEPS